MLKSSLRKILTGWLSVVLTPLVLFSFCGVAVASSPTVLKLAHQWPAPQNGKGDDRSLMAVKFARQVEELSNGALKVQVYPGNSLIPPRQQWNALRSGALDMAVIVPSYFSGQVSEFSGLNMMGLVNSNAAAYQLMEGPGGDVLRNLFKEHGVRLLASQWGPETVGFRNQQVTEPSGLKGLRMRGPGPAIEKVFANSGAGIVSMPSSDLYTALQTGAIDGAITTFISMHSYRLYENFKYVAVSPTNGGLLYAMSPLVMSNATWKKLTKAQQKVIEKAAKAIQPWVRKQTDSEAKRNAKFFESQGVHVYKLTDKQFDAWMDAAKPIVDAYANSSKTASEIVKYARETNKSVAKH